MKTAVQYLILDGYWRSRMSAYLIEIDDIAEDDLDWGVFVLGDREN